jgi:hypothetical protein
MDLHRSLQSGSFGIAQLSGGRINYVSLVRVLALALFQRTRSFTLKRVERFQPYVRGMRVSELAMKE